MSAQKKFTLSAQKQDSLLLLGIISDEKEYKICWHLNKILGVQLKKSSDFQWMNKQMQSSQAFPCYRDHIANGKSIHLIRNLSAEHIQIYSFQLFDYLFVIPPEHKLFQNSDVITQLRNSNLIRGVYQLDASTLIEWLG